MRATELLGPGDVGKLAGVSADRVRQWGDEGRLLPAFRTPDGRRLYDPAAVDAFLAERAAQIAARAAANVRSTSREPVSAE